MRMSPPEVLRSCRTISFAQSNTTAQWLSMPGFRQRTRRGQRAPVALGGDELRGEVAPDRIGRMGRKHPRATQRIVSLAPSATSILCAIGAKSQLVGVTKWCADVAPVAKLPKLGD